jgi:tyrosyl-tRNA synthetase
LNREKFVITTTLLTNPVTGEKLMSKSLGTGVGLNETPQEMFGKVMALADAGIVQTFLDCTRLPVEKVTDIRKRYESGENPKILKLELAREIVKMYHGEAEADKAFESFEKTFSQGGVPEDIQEIKLSGDTSLIEELIKAGIVPSKTEWRRLVKDGAVKLENDEKIADPDFKPTDKTILKIGKRRFVRIVTGLS